MLPFDGCDPVGWITRAKHTLRVRTLNPQNQTQAMKLASVFETELCDALVHRGSGESRLGRRFK